MGGGKGGKGGSSGGGNKNKNTRSKTGYPGYGKMTSRDKKHAQSQASKGIGTSVQAAYNRGERGWAVGKDATSYSAGNVGNPNSAAAKAYKARHGEAAYSSYAKQYAKFQPGYSASQPGKTAKMSFVGDLPNTAQSLFGVDYKKNFEKGKESFLSKLASGISGWRGLDGKGMTLGEKFSNPTGAFAETFTGDKNYFTAAANQQRMMDQAIASKERIYGKDWKSKLGFDKLNEGQFQDAMIGDFTGTPGIDAAAVGLGAIGIKAAPSVLSGIGGWYNKGRLTGNMNLGQLLKNDWGHRGGFLGPAGKGGWDFTRGFRTLNPAKGGLLSGPTELVRRANETGVLGPLLGGAGALGWGIGSTANKGIESLSNNPAVRGALSSVFNRTPIGMASNLTQSVAPADANLTNTQKLQSLIQGPGQSLLNVWGATQGLPGTAFDAQHDKLRSALDGFNKFDSDITKNILQGQGPYPRGFLNMFKGDLNLSIDKEIANYKKKAIDTYGTDSAQAAFWAKPENMSAWRGKILKERFNKYAAYGVFGAKGEEGDAYRQQLGDMLGVGTAYSEFLGENKKFDLADFARLPKLWNALGQESDPIPNLKTSPFGIDSIKNLFAKTYVGDAAAMAAFDHFDKTGQLDTLGTLLNMSKGEPREKINQLMKLAGLYKGAEEFIQNPVEGIQSRLGIDTGEQGRRREQRIRRSGTNPFPDLNIDPRIGQQLSQQMYQQGNWDLSNLWREQEISDRLYSEEIARIQQDQSLYDTQLGAIRSDLANYDAELARVQGQGAEWGHDPEYKKYLDQIASNQKSLSDYFSETTQHKSDLDAYMAKYTSDYNLQKAGTKSKAIQYEQLMASSNRRPVSGIRMARQGWNYNASPTTAFNRRFRNKSNLTTQSINV